MSTTTAKIAALNKTDNTGISPKIADELYNQLGKNMIAVASFSSSERTEGVDDSKSIKLNIDFIEPADNEDTEEYLRELQRALYRKRNPQPALTNGDPTEADVTEVVIRGQIQLHCLRCSNRWKNPTIVHARGTAEEGYPACYWTNCGHSVNFHAEDDCPAQVTNTQTQLANT